jgi:thiamine-monophosphate kinase
MGSGAEFDRIRAIFAQLGNRAAPSGDDCAIVTVGGERIAVSTDLTVEGTHFRAGWLEPNEIGWRAATAALSDLAAVAAEPIGVLASVAVPREWSAERVANLMEGVGAAAAAVGGVVLGGDLVRSERVVIDVTVIGRLGTVVGRSGGHVGDGLWVTGTLGAPRAAIRAWAAGREPTARSRARFAHPVPRIAEAAWLRDLGVTAMIDLSDGLAADAGHLAAASAVACAIESERVPVDAGADRPEDAVVGGEEYELLAAMPTGFDDDEARRFQAQFDLPLTRVGVLREGQGVTVLRGGKPSALDGTFRHFE